MYGIRRFFKKSSFLNEVTNFSKNRENQENHISQYHNQIWKSFPDLKKVRHS